MAPGLGLQTSLFKKRPSYGFVPAGNVCMSDRLGNDNRPGYERHQRLEKLLRIFRPSLLEQWSNHALHFGEMRGNPCPDLRLISLRAELGQRLDKGAATEARILDGQFKRIEDSEQFCRRSLGGVAGELRDEALPVLFFLVVRFQRGPTTYLWNLRRTRKPKVLSTKCMKQLSLICPR